MKRIQKQSSNAAPRHRAMAGLLLGLFVFVLAMAEFGALHRLMHPEAGHAEHHCAVTMLAGGQVDVATGEVRVAFTPAVAVAVVVPAAQIFVAVDYSLLPGRAPPVALS